MGYVIALDFAHDWVRYTRMSLQSASCFVALATAVVFVGTERTGYSRLTIAAVLGLFTYLHSAGRTQAHKWIGQHLRAVGRRETVDLAARFQARNVSAEAEDEGDAGGDDAAADAVASRA